MDPGLAIDQEYRAYETIRTVLTQMRSCATVTRRIVSYDRRRRFVNTGIESSTSIHLRQRFLPPRIGCIAHGLSRTSSAGGWLPATAS